MADSFSINREEAAAAINQADAVLSELGNRLKSIEVNVWDLANVLRAEEKSQMGLSNDTFGERLENLSIEIAAQMPQLNKELISLVNSGGEAIGATVQYQNNHYNHCIHDKIGKVSDEVGITSLNDLMNILQSFSNRISEFDGVVDEGIACYKRLFDIAANYPDIQAKANTTCNTLRDFANKLKEAVDTYKADIDDYVRSFYNTSIAHDLATESLLNRIKNISTGTIYEHETYEAGQ